MASQPYRTITKAIWNNPDTMETITNCVASGYTSSKEIAQHLNISESVFKNWKYGSRDAECIEISQKIYNAIDEGYILLRKTISNKAESSLIKLVEGYTVIEKKLKYKRTYPNRNDLTTYERTIVEEIEQEKYIPPNANAVLFALINLFPGMYKPTNSNHSENETSQDNINIRIGFSDDE